MHHSEVRFDSITYDKWDLRKNFFNEDHGPEIQVQNHHDDAPRRFKSS